ncbi:concanavalin A-like lectin/glucanase domain-containing protein, partial [Mycena capillaripes]
GEYIIEWNETARFLGGKGWSPGSATTVVQFTTDYSQTGTSQLALYGRTTNPLVEYYITEAFSGSLPFADLELKGNVTSDGSVYNIYEGQRVDAKGNGIFRQYWSVRQSTRSRGLLTTANHFKAWDTLGMPLDDLGHQIFSVESHAGSGSIYVFMNGVTAVSSECCSRIIH